MSLVKNVHELQISAKTALLSVFGQAHYFLIAIFLFRYDLVEKIDNRLLLDINFYYILLISFTFSALWFAMNVSISMMTPFICAKRNQYSDIYFSSMVCSVGYLSAALLLAYILDSDFYHFIAYAFMFIALRLCWTIFKLMIQKKLL